MIRFLSQSTLIVMISSTALAQTPQEFSFRRGQPAAARPVATVPSAEPVATVPAPKVERASTPTENINPLVYSGDIPKATKLHPAPRGCGFYRGNFGINECSRLKKSDGSFGMFCRAAYVNPTEGLTGKVASYWPWSAQGKAVQYNFEVKDAAVEAFLCAKQSDASLKAAFKGQGKAVENLPISIGLNLCDAEHKLYSDRANYNRHFERVAGEMSVDALKSRAARFIQKSGKTPEQVLADCVANVRVAPAPVANDTQQLPVEPKKPQTVQPTIVKETDKPVTVAPKQAPRTHLPAPLPVDGVAPMTGHR